MKNFPKLTLAFTATVVGVWLYSAHLTERLDQPLSAAELGAANASRSLLLAQNEPADTTRAGKKSDTAAPKTAAGKQDSKASGTKGSGKQDAAKKNAAKKDAAKEDAASKPEPKASPAALETLTLARNKLIGKRIRAQILETVAIGPSKFKVTGSYLQGTDLKLRLDFKVQVGDSIGSLLEVCDGQVLWTRQSLSSLSREAEKAKQKKSSKKKTTKKAKKTDDVRITRRDVREILNAAASRGSVPKNMLVAELGLGGLPGLLASLERTMRFESLSKETVDKQQFTVIEGTWNKTYSDRWRDATKKDDSNRLPEYIPDRVRIYFDDQFLFPRRILYLKQHVTRDYFRPMVTLDFTKVEFDVAVNDEDFLFVPPDGVFPVDVTKQYTRQLTPARTSSPLSIQKNAKPLPKNSK